MIMIDQGNIHVEYFNGKIVITCNKAIVVCYRFSLCFNASKIFICNSKSIINQFILIALAFTYRKLSLTYINLEGELHPSYEIFYLVKVFVFDP